VVDIQTFLEKLSEREQARMEVSFRGSGMGIRVPGCGDDGEGVRSNLFCHGTYDLSWNQAIFNSAFPWGTEKKGNARDACDKAGAVSAEQVGFVRHARKCLAVGVGICTTIRARSA